MLQEPLSDIEYDILNTIYFVEPFQNILDECKAPEAVVADVLKQLIHKKYVTPMQFDEEKQEYVRTFFYDTDNMRAYHYLATKEGLLAHNSR
jgi:hypothetical protein